MDEKGSSHWARAGDSTGWLHNRSPGRVMLDHFAPWRWTPGSSISGYTIGWDEYGVIIAAKGVGTVLYANGRTPEVIGFFNSSVAAFGEFLFRYEHHSRPSTPWR